MWINSRFVFAALIATSPLSARAQSAEETAAFILYGMEDGREATVDGRDISAHQSGSSPTVFKVAGNVLFDELKEVSVTSGGSCQIDVRGKIRDEEFVSEIDFSRFIGAEDIAGMTYLRFSGQCPVRNNGNCNKLAVSAGPFSVNYDRLTLAIKHFKKTYCPGSAY